MNVLTWPQTKVDAASSATISLKRGKHVRFCLREELNGKIPCSDGSCMYSKLRSSPSHYTCCQKNYFFKSCSSSPFTILHFVLKFLEMQSFLCTNLPSAFLACHHVNMSGVSTCLARVNVKSCQREISHSS